MRRLMWCWFSLIGCCLVLSASSSSSGLRKRRERLRDERKCEPITIGVCKNIGYNLTYMPNRFQHKTQYDAGLIVAQFSLLISTNCSPRLRHFVCSLYTPMCDPVYKKEVVPCRSFCQEVKDACEPTMALRGFSWPEHMDCHNFPRYQDYHICMKPESPQPTTPQPPPPTAPDRHRPQPPVVPVVVPPRRSGRVPKRGGGGGGVVGGGGVADGSCGCSCRAPFVYHENRTLLGQETYPPCVLPCQKWYFSSEQQRFIQFWLGLWSVLAFVSTLVACLTFLVDRSKRLVYCERPMFWLALCYNLVAVGHFVRLGAGFERVACNAQTGLLQYSTTGPAPCTAVFMLTYFFGAVAWIWWVVLCVTWFLTAGLRWSNEAVAAHAQHFHFIAWLLPTVQTMAILAMAAVDSDPVAGLCSVGNHDNDTLKIFVIAPLLIYIVLGACFLLAGCVALACNRRADRGGTARQNQHPVAVTGGKPCEKLARVLRRTGAFCACGLLVAVALLVTHFYEHNHKQQWEMSNNCACVKWKSKPTVHVFFVKYFCLLAVGVQTGFWMLNRSCARAWTHCCSTFMRRRDCRGEHHTTDDATGGCARESAVNSVRGGSSNGSVRNGSNNNFDSRSESHSKYEVYSSNQLVHL